MSQETGFLQPLLHPAQPRSNIVHKILGSPSTVFIGDLPKDLTQVELYEFLKQQVGGDFELVLKR